MTLVVSPTGKYGLKCEDPSLGTGPSLFVLFFTRGRMDVETSSSTGESGGVCCRGDLGGVGLGRGSVGSLSWSGGGTSVSRGSPWSEGS